MAYVYQEYPKILYHHKLAPKGKRFESPEETKGLGRKWVDTPAKFPKPSRFALAIEATKPWWTRWEWAVRAAATILALAAAAVAFVKALLW